MAVVVEQTIPFSSSSLDLQNPLRWNELYPLMRPALTKIQAGKGQSILISKTIINSKYANTAAVISSGHVSSKVLDGCRAAAVVAQEPGADVLTAQDIQQALRESGGATESQGLVVVRAGQSRNVKVDEPLYTLDVEVNGQLEFDHVLHILANIDPATRRATEFLEGVIQLFMKCAVTVYLTFKTEKVGDKPAISSGSEGSSASFESVKSTVQKELESLFKSQKVQSGKITYSIHYSDINGLSRLENYIIAKEISEYCCEYMVAVNPLYC